MPELSELIELLEAIDGSEDKVQITEINFNGRKWFWKMPQHNLTATEWTIRKRRWAQKRDYDKH
jgi:hypothetical protein